MSDPLSFLASVLAIAALAEKVVIRGYCYLKAVKNCPDEVRTLMAETNVLCGILGRLNVLLEGNRSKLGATTQPTERANQNSDGNEELTAEEHVASSDDEAISGTDNGTIYPSIVSAILSKTYALLSASSSGLHL